MKNFHHSGNCPIRDVLCRLGDKWSILVLVTLHANEILRFGEIQKTIGDISHRMLSVTLRSLENDGMIERKAYAEIPPRVEYKLSPRGERLIPHLESLVQWVLTEMEDILKERAEKQASR